jgi:hypothetical protein
VEINMCDFGDMPMKIVKLRCPNCNTDLMQGSAIGTKQSGIKKSLMIYDRKNNNFDFDEYDFETDDVVNEFEYIKCGADVSEVIKRYI